MTGTEAMKVGLDVGRVKNKRRYSSSAIKEQEVPLSKTASLDESSSSSMPSSPTSSSHIEDTVIHTPPSFVAVKMAEKTPWTKKSPAVVVHQNGGSSSSSLVVGGEATSSSSPHLASLLNKARAAMSALLPLFDKMPQEVAFGDDVLGSIKSPSFTSFCETEVQKAPMYMQASVVLTHLEDFAKKDSPLQNGKSNFKRPHSPHSAHTPAGPSGQLAKKSKPVLGASSSLPKPEEALTSGDLKARLQAKLAAFRVKRKAILDPEESASFNDIRRRLNRMKKKEKLRNKKAVKKELDKPSGEGTKSADGDGSSTPSSARSSSVVSEEGKMIFSRFDFFDADGGEKRPHPKQLAGKNLTHLINKAEADTRKMEELQTTDEKKAAAVREKKAWSEALLKAQGVKLKNDPVKLKHALKEQTKRKDKSTKKWQERKQNIEQEQKQRQEKRQTNIKARQTAKKNKKRKRSIKKGHIIPGFN